MRLASLYLEAINYVSHKPQLDSLAKQLNKTPQEIIALVEPITNITRYVEWILRQLKTNTIRLPEDAGRIKQLLTDFDHYKSIGAADINRDVGSYKTIHDLEVVIDELKGIDLKGRAETRQEYREGTQWVKESSNYKILKITTPEAAAHYALNTKWCTSDPETAKVYLEEGPLYIIFKKQPDGKLRKLYQYTHDYSQFMDILDKPIKPDKEIQRLIKPLLNSKPEILVRFCVLVGFRWLEAEPYIVRDPEWACFYAMNVLKGRFPEAEPYIAQDSKLAYDYALYVLRHSWSEAEPAIVKDPYLAYCYARDVLRRPWPEAEQYIIQSPRYACFYAQDVLRRPWPEAEPAIAKDPYLAYCYARDVLKDRFPEAESYIAKNPCWAYHYALGVLKRRFPEAEPYIAKNPQQAHGYAIYILRGRFSEAEPYIAKDPEWAYFYARDTLKGRFPEAEPTIAKNAHHAYYYARYVLRDRFHEAEPLIAQNPGYWARYKRYFNVEG